MSGQQEHHALLVKHGLSIEMEIEKISRPFLSLQALAFRGEEVEPPQLRFRGLDLSSIPVGVKRLSLQCTLWCSQA
ncbi:hypothetical protein [Rossellomorea marisflavi]|uniref:hypothetical protein n=1 Tax=Rossellomorea marisflavi TaxID=189381 RepID=UPI00295EAB14|nr:hypothetical protein [Rossellomorea marisflavi]